MAHNPIQTRELHRKPHCSEWWSRLSGVLLVLACTSSAGETLFKCVQSDGVPSFQSAPCVAGTREVWARQVQAEPEVARAKPLPSSMSRRSGARQTGSGAGSRSAPGRDNCIAARQAAAEERERRWREVTIDDLRRMDDQVQHACRRR